jgi:hypothetical protein
MTGMTQLFIDTGPITFIRRHWLITEGTQASISFHCQEVVWRLLLVRLAPYPNSVAAMDTQQPKPRPLPKIKFRVLIIGRANAGKTSILQRVCGTTQSPIIYRRSGYNEERVRGLNLSRVVTRPVWSYRATRLNSNHPWRLVISHHLSVTTDPSHSVASTGSMTSSFSPIMTVIFFMIPADLSRETTRN